MNVQFTVRLHRPADHDQIRWLHVRTPAWGNVAWRPEPMHPEIERIDEHFAAFWVAVENAGAEDVVVGITGIDEVRDRTSLGMNVPEFIDCGRRLGQLHWVQVAPERWRTGIGRALVGTTIEWVRTRGYEGLILETTAQQTAAIKLYEGLGFKEAGRTMFGQWEQVWMELALA